ncbi:MAG: NUDIX hydrolase [Cyclobacteriaceae bacterium]
MRGNKTISDYLVRVQAMAKTGLTYAKDPYDIERYEALAEQTNELLAEHSNLEQEDIDLHFEKLDPYPTPKVDVRGVILSEGKILLIKEKSDQKWAMPGGWADVGVSPSENVVKEVWEEAGLEVKAERLLAVWDKMKHDHPTDLNHVYKLNFLCRVTGGELKPGHEVLEARFFGLNELPELSLMRNTVQQIKTLHRLAQVNESTRFD